MDDIETQTDRDHGEPKIVGVFSASGLLGYVAIATSIRAITADNIEIGRFKTEAEARNAIVHHAFAGRASS